MLRIFRIGERRTKGHELPRRSQQFSDSGMLPLAGYEDVFTFGNLAALVTIDRLIEIKTQTILDIASRFEHCHRPKLRRNVLLLNLLDKCRHLTTGVSLA